jgi:monovalent cation:proton antiporter-2 (CPA2) family protein
VFLVASAISVPIAKRLGLGSVLGYLIAGALIGPFGLNLLGEAESAMHAAEFGVVIMLFLIGLELEPALLWRMRGAILGLGGAQVLLSGLALAGAGMAIGFDWRVSLAAGFAFALSSTAIVLQSLREKGLADTDPGRASLSVLLFQDVAVIPMLVLIPLLAAAPAPNAAAHASAIAALPFWAQPLTAFAAVTLIIVAGRFLARPMFRIVAAARIPEIFTATALAIVVGVALLMQLVGMSPALGAFVAGVVLADSEFRHEIEADIEPFRALLLGLFFISVGAALNFDAVLAAPALVAGLVAGLIAIKALVLFLVAVAARRGKPDAALMALALAPGGEFAFVLFSFAASTGVIAPDLAATFSAAAAFSMAATPLLLVLGERLSTKLAGPEAERALPAHIPSQHPQVIIAGFGRFGQIAHRLVLANGFNTSILEHNAEQVETMRTFGNKANYGDAAREDLLRAAGAESARVLVVAVDDQDKAIQIVETARRAFPHLKVLARAYDRRHVYELMKAGADGIERETFEAALRLGAATLRTLGYGTHRAERAAGLFRRYDELGLAAMFENWSAGDFDAYRSAINERRDMVEEMLRRDMTGHGVLGGDTAWDTQSLDEAAKKRA